MGAWNKWCPSARGLMLVCLLQACGGERAPDAPSDLRASGRASAGTQAVLVPSVSATVGANEPVCAAISQQAQNQRTPADIIIAVDNSGSMSEEIGFVRDQLNAFSERIVASGVDVRIILISAPYSPASARDADDDADESDEDEDNGLCIAPPLGSGSCPSDSFGSGFLHVAQEVKSHDALELIIEKFPEYRDRLRPESNKVFVVVTDDDSDNSADWFAQRVASLPGGLFSHWRFSGIYCFSDCPEAAAVGGQYRDLVLRTHGVAGDLCQQDFTPVFDALAQAIVGSSGLACAWNIPAPPMGMMFDRQRVNVQYSGASIARTQLFQTTGSAECGARGGWYYDDPQAPQRILVCPATCSELQRDPSTEVEVLFGCGTQLAPD